jgi:proteasome lid subunit RPN8/RPN11
MDDEIQFGEVEEKRPDKSLRPDRNAHYCCISMGAPSDVDLPIFVDLDALLDMEDHAKSDMRVELGGVMLGGHFEDDDGKPFVVITDTLRAQHYESTKGSFKFTHDTWAEISRRRDAYPPQTQMVGWYHTHPDWGVFLSGMDLFICDHFFNKPLDVAFVIDPCRRHRGMFQWTEGADRKVRPTRGFYAIASRFRQHELAAYAALLEESAMSADLRRFSGPSAGSSIIQAINPKDQMTIPIILLMMMLQFGLLAVLVWTSLLGQNKETTENLAALNKEVSELRTTLETHTPLAAQKEILDVVFSELKETRPGTAQRLVEMARSEKAMEAALLGQKEALESAKRRTELQAIDLKKLSEDLVIAEAELKAQEKANTELKTLVEAKTATITWKELAMSPLAWGCMVVAAFVGAGLSMIPNAMKTREEELVAKEPTIEPRQIDS